MFAFGHACKPSIRTCPPPFRLAPGEEIWRQTGGAIDAFVSGAGTGGTIAGVSAALKAHNPAVRVLLVDPPGSSLYNKVKRGVMYTREEADGRRLRNPFDTITEGIGINRLTHNFGLASIDDAFRGEQAGKRRQACKHVCNLHAQGQAPCSRGHAMPLLSEAARPRLKHRASNYWQAHAVCAGTDCRQRLYSTCRPPWTATCMTQSQLRLP